VLGFGLDAEVALDRCLGLVDELIFAAGQDVRIAGAAHEDAEDPLASRGAAFEEVGAEEDAEGAAFGLLAGDEEAEAVDFGLDLCVVVAAVHADEGAVGELVELVGDFRDARGGASWRRCSRRR
jgi:hypothetical protein